MTTRSPLNSKAGINRFIGVPTCFAHQRDHDLRVLCLNQITLHDLRVLCLNQITLHDVQKGHRMIAPGLFSSRMEEMPSFPPLPHTVMPRLDLGISRHHPCGCHETSG
jgi:hypothetical protein